MKTVLILLTIILSLTCQAQGISYKDLTEVDWNDHPFSLVELLIDKGFEFDQQRTLDGDLFEHEREDKESLYELTYLKINESNAIGAYVCVDKLNSNELSDNLPAIKLRYMYQSKESYIQLSDEIKEACGEPDMGFYVSSDSLTFVLDKELIDGVPSYYILIYVMSKESMEEMKKAVKKLLQEMSEKQE